jgi:hypothetical protein
MVIIRREVARKESSRNWEYCSDGTAILRNVSFREKHGKGERGRYAAGKRTGR